MQGIINEKLNVLVFGSGAREHAMAEAISKSPLLGTLYVAEAGFAKLGEEINFETYDDLAKKCVEKKIDIVIVGPEEPLCDGIADIFKENGVFCVGVNKEFSQLESSKLFGKDFMEQHKIKTAKYVSIDSNVKASDIKFSKFPIVIKADGLCKGKGVVVASNEAFARKTIEEYLNGKFGENSKTILLEEFLQGEEVSLISLWDGKNLLDLVPAKDFKKLNKSESAPNTGGMGAYCPVKMSQEKRAKLNAYKMRLKSSLLAEKADFCGFIYSGLIWVENNGVGDWYVLEYNVRMGDPETQVILDHLKTDFLSILNAAKNKELDKVEAKYKSGYTACLTIAVQGYPKAPKIGEAITIKTEPGVRIYYAGVKMADGEMVSSGGRVLSICTTGNTPFDVLRRYAKKVNMNNKYYRDDLDIE